MTSLPADGTLLDSGGTLTTANAKINLEYLRDHAAERFGSCATSELTISSGSVTPTGGLHSIDTESDAASDDLANIVTTNLDDGSLLLIYPEDGARTVVVKHAATGAGQVHLADDSDFTMDEADKTLLLYRSGTDWYELMRNYGASLDDYRTYLGLGTAAVCDTGVANGNVIAADATGIPAIDGSQVTDLNTAETRGEYLLVQDQKAAGTDGGTFTSGSWQTRVLNTEVVDEGSVCTLSANQMTLIAGTYYFKISAPAYRVSTHKARLIESTSTITIYGGVGTSEVSSSADLTTSRSVVCGKFTITSANVTGGENILEVQHYCGTTHADEGFGWPSSFGVTEVYTVVEMWRVD